MLTFDQVPLTIFRGLSYFLEAYSWGTATLPAAHMLWPMPWTASKRWRENPLYRYAWESLNVVPYESWLTSSLYPHVQVILFRNTMSFAFNYAITPWIDDQGLQNTFIAVAVLAFAFGASFLLMEWKGKYLRTISAARYWAYTAS